MGVCMYMYTYVYRLIAFKLLASSRNNIRFGMTLLSPETFTAGSVTALYSFEG